MSMTVVGVQVVEGKATELNFTLAPLGNEPTGGITVPFTTTTVPTTTSVLTTTSDPDSTTIETSSTTSEMGTSGANESYTPQEAQPPAQPEHQPIQPQDFRHHHYNDMELFLRRYYYVCFIGLPLQLSISNVMLTSNVRM